MAKKKATPKKKPAKAPVKKVKKPAPTKGKKPAPAPKKKSAPKSRTPVKKAAQKASPKAKAGAKPKATAKPKPAPKAKAAPKKVTKTKAAPPKPAKPVAPKKAAPAKAVTPAKPAPALKKAAPPAKAAPPKAPAAAPAKAPAPQPKAAPAPPAKSGRTPKPKEPIIAVMTGLEPLGGPAKTLKRALKERYQLEFYLRATPGSLYDLISSPSGFSEWFCDDVNVSGDEFSFKWGNEVQAAECLSRKFGEMIRFRWMEDEDPGAFFELRIRIDTMTNETCLVVTDHAWPKDLDEAKALWDSQIHTLARVLGA